MPTDDLGQQLHDRATRGEPLNPEEQAHLRASYAQLGQAERAQLAGNRLAAPLARLRVLVAEAMAELLKMAQRVQTLTHENEDLRQEIVRLQGQLTARSTTQPA